MDYDSFYNYREPVIRPHKFIMLAIAVLLIILVCLPQRSYAVGADSAADLPHQTQVTFSQSIRPGTCYDTLNTDMDLQDNGFAGSVDFISTWDCTIQR